MATKKKKKKKKKAKKKTTTKRRSSKRSSAKKSRRWSKRVMERSDALDLEEGVFTHDDPRKVALSLKRSAEKSKRRKAEPYRSAMSMLSFYINRAGKGMSKKQKATLEKAKDELRDLYGRPRQSS